MYLVYDFYDCHFISCAGFVISITVSSFYFYPMCHSTSMATGVAETRRKLPCIKSILLPYILLVLLQGIKSKNSLFVIKFDPSQSWPSLSSWSLVQRSVLS